MTKQQQLSAQVTALLAAQDAFQDVRGRTHTALLRVEDSLGDRIAESEPMTLEVTLQKRHQIFFGFGLPLKGPGLYRIMAFLDGMKEIEHPLFVREKAAAKAGSTEPEGGNPKMVTTLNDNDAVRINLQGSTLVTLNTRHFAKVSIAELAIKGIDQNARDWVTALGI